MAREQLILKWFINFPIYWILRLGYPVFHVLQAKWQMQLLTRSTLVHVSHQQNSHYGVLEDPRRPRIWSIFGWGGWGYNDGGTTYGCMFPSLHPHFSVIFHNIISILFSHCTSFSPISAAHPRSRLRIFLFIPFIPFCRDYNVRKIIKEIMACQWLLLRN